MQNRNVGIIPSILSIPTQLLGWFPYDSLGIMCSEDRQLP